VDQSKGAAEAIHDDAARSFAIGFYGGLGEYESIAVAFEQAKAAIHLDGLPDADRPQLQVRDGFDPAELILAAVPPSGLVAVQCPYPGMRPFAADDAGSFHGREAEIAELISRFRAGQREIFVIGPSGSGKSSLVAAGVLPRLARGLSGLGPLVVRELRPGDQPFSRLCQTLDAPPGEPLAAADRVTALLAHRAPGASALIVVDQLEELFTQAIVEERAAFFDALRALRTESRCAVIYTLRADFSGALMESPLWPERPAQLARVEVTPLRGTALREAIAAPAEAVGVTVEPELIERLVGDAASEPGILPLLQEALVQLWDARADQTLTLADYQALGDGVRSGLAVALAHRADATLQRFNAAQTDIAWRILLRLISFGEGRSDTRRQQPRAQLRAAGEDAADFEFVLRTMVDHRLLTVDEGVDGEARVDLAHEIMISAWPTLARWIRSHRVDEQRRRQLEATAAQWGEHGHGVRGLLESDRARRGGAVAADGVRGPARADRTGHGAHRGQQGRADPATPTAPPHWWCRRPPGSGCGRRHCRGPSRTRPGERGAEAEAQGGGRRAQESRTRGPVVRGSRPTVPRRSPLSGSGPVSSSGSPRRHCPRVSAAWYDVLGGRASFAAHQRRASGSGVERRVQPRRHARGHRERGHDRAGVGRGDRPAAHPPAQASGNGVERCV